MPEALDKLAALGDRDHIAMALAEQGIEAVPRDAEHCVVAMYLKKEVQDAWDIVVSISGSRATKGDAMWMEAGGHCYTNLPEVVNDLAAAFDEGKYPELEAGGPSCGDGTVDHVVDTKG